MIPYFQAGQSMVVAKGNPNKISTPMDLCGKSRGGRKWHNGGRLPAGHGDYKASGGPMQCTKGGKPAVMWW